jgi:hypothetical protein
VKSPKGLLEKESPSCPICGKLFKSLKNLDDHIQNLRKLDLVHQAFSEDKMSFEIGDQWKKQGTTDQDQKHIKPKFGRIIIKKKK